jgi:polysaccharide pyruvyl transferase WcaK-like protein
MKVVILNCYSAKNSGDGLLVDLAIKKIEAQHSGADIVLVASDPSSFNGRHPSIHNEYFHNPGALSLIKILVKVCAFLITKKYSYKGYSGLVDADFVYSVGGGYLRFGFFTETLKTIVIHLSQLAWAQSNAKGRHILLSQSIGPFRFMPLSVVGKFLSKAQSIELRDDRSFHELSAAGLPVHRTVDLAVGQLKNDLTVKSYQDDPAVCIVVLRDIRRGRLKTAEFIAKIHLISKNFNRVVFAIQSQVNGNDDSEFYKQHGIISNVSLVDALKKNPGAIVVSVRLHGALESMIKGHKTLHLSYERKGFGAFEDLGLSEFVMNVYDFNEDSLIDRLSCLKALSAQEYFNNIKKIL